MIRAKVIADSVGASGNDSRITTLQLRYPRRIHAQVMTNRFWVVSARSSRAVPTRTLTSEVLKDPVKVKWRKYQKGMVALEPLDAGTEQVCEDKWQHLLRQTINIAEQLEFLGASKESVNRFLEPFMWIDVVVTFTHKAWVPCGNERTLFEPFNNFLVQRLASDASEDIQELARAMSNAVYHSTPDKTQFHTPYVTIPPHTKVLEKNVIAASAYRCASVSYKAQNVGAREVTETDVKKGLRLWTDGHEKPFEHVAIHQPTNNHGQYGPYYGWVSSRPYIFPHLFCGGDYDTP